MNVQAFAEWIAPVATMIAAMMTAANLGARFTGWGFIIFAVGSVAWSIVGIITGQTNLVVTNLFLTIVNVVGIWRWLGRQASYEDGGKYAARKSRNIPHPSLFTGGGVMGKEVVDCAGSSLGKAVEMLIECKSGGISYVVIATGDFAGIHEELRAVPHEQISYCEECFTMKVSRAEFEKLPPIKGDHWPALA